jgi:hypothetical protein
MLHQGQQQTVASLRAQLKEASGSGARFAAAKLAPFHCAHFDFVLQHNQQIRLPNSITPPCRVLKRSS